MDKKEKERRRRRRRLGFWWCCCGFWLFGLIITATIPAILLVNIPKVVIPTTTTTGSTTLVTTTTTGTTTTLVTTTTTVTTTTLVPTTTTLAPTTNPAFTNKVYVAYDTHPTRSFRPDALYFLGNYTQLGLMDVGTGVIQHITPIIVTWDAPWVYYVRSIVMGPDNILYGVSEWILTVAGPAYDRFLKINITTGATQIICPLIGYMFPYKTDALLITKDGLVYLKSQTSFGDTSYLQRLNLTSCTLSNVGLPFATINGAEYGGKLYFVTNTSQLVYMTIPDYTLHYDATYNLPYNATGTGYPPQDDRGSAPVGLFPYVDAYGVTSLRTMFLPDPRDTEYFVQINIGTGTITYFLNRTLNGNDQIVYDCATTYYYNLTGPPSPPIAKKRDAIPMSLLYIIVYLESALFTYDPNTMTVTPVVDLGFAIDRLFKQHVQSGNNIYTLGGSLVCTGVNDKVIGSDTQGNAYLISDTTLTKLNLATCSSEILNNNLAHNCVNVSATFQDSVYCITPQNEFVNLLTDTAIGITQLQAFNNQLFEYQGELIFYYNENVFKRVNITSGEFLYPDLQLSYVFGQPSTPWQFSS